MNTTKKIASRKASPLKEIHRKAARLLLAGWTYAMVGKEIGIRPTIVQDWHYRTEFIKYLTELESRYHAILDKEILSLRRNAFQVLREGLGSKDLVHQRWAVSTILTSTVTQEMTLNLNSNVGAGETLRPEAVKAAKDYLSLTSPSYEQTGVGNGEA